MAFRDVCSGPHCTNLCPDELFLEEESAGVWPDGAKIVIASMVLAIAAGCIVMKVCSLMNAICIIISLILTELCYFLVQCVDILLYMVQTSS